MPKCDIPHGPHRRYVVNASNCWGFETLRAILRIISAVAPGLLLPSAAEEMQMSALANPIFWNMKIKIAILTLATFAALC